MIKDKLAQVPAQSGIYIFKDKNNEIIYIGKAKSLDKRLRQYFGAPDKLNIKTKVLVSKIEDFEYILTDNELEALILENNLIKKHKPRYNVLLKDDKNFPYLKITMNEEFPRLISSRKLKKDGSSYFGPFSPANQLWKMTSMLRQYFPLRECKTSKLRIRERPCLNFQMGLCTSPCSGAITKEDYMKIIDDLARFLNGKSVSLLSDLEKRMQKASDDLQFEAAAKIRDQMFAIRTVLKEQKMITTTMADRDLIAYAEDENLILFQLFFVRGGIITGRRHFILNNQGGFDIEDLFAQFIRQYYSRGEFIPSEIACELDFPDSPIIAQYLSSLTASSIKLTFPKRGEKQRLIELVKKNAQESLQEHIRKGLIDKSVILDELRQRLRLRRVPTRIEGFDISNIQGVLAVGSMVCFIEGEAAKAEYRRFKIRTIQGANDVGMMMEVLNRHFTRKLESKQPMPDLLLIDGGKMHLNAALSVLNGLSIKGIDVIGFAKPDKTPISKDEVKETIDKVFLPNVKDPNILAKGSKPLFLLQNIRDEAHRFAITYHKKLREKKLKSSLLEEVPGIGKVRKKLLLRHFGSLKKLREASLDEILSVDKLDSKTAKSIYDFLHGKM
jgi:excinuclease ABC subunit C